MNIKCTILSVAMMTTLVSCSSSPAVTSFTTNTTNPAAVATKALSTTAVATIPATAPTTTSTVNNEDAKAERILTIFKEEYGSLFDVVLKNKTFYFESKSEEFLNDFNLAISGNEQHINNLRSFVEGLAEVSNSFPIELKGYDVSVRNPVNREYEIFSINNGVIQYSFLDEIEMDEKPDSSTALSESEEQILGLFEKYYDEDYDIRLENTTFYLDPTNETIITGIALTMQGQKVGIDFWKQLMDNFNVISANFPEELKEYTIHITNPVDKDKILFVSKQGETFYDAFKE